VKALLKIAESTHTKTMPGGDKLDVYHMLSKMKGRPTEEVDLSSLSPSRSKRHGFSPKRLAAADTSYPIVIGPKGQLLDGRHRTLKMMGEGKVGRAIAYRASEGDVMGSLLAPGAKPMTLKALQKTAAGKKAVIIHGNPKWNDHPQESAKFYRDLERHLKSRGWSVSHDPGKPFTSPDKSAQLWVGFSRGAGRLKWAPPEIKTLAIGSGLPGAVSHPKDVSSLPENLGKAVRPDKWHYVFTPEMKAAIDKLG
jgi:hypothetical protein